MKIKAKIIIAGVLAGFIAFPAIALGGSFVSSLIQGKTVDQAIRILAEQMDALIGRVEVVETKQVEQEKNVLELQNIINQQKALIEQLQLSQKNNETQIIKNTECREKYEIFQEALKIWACTPGTKWWVAGQEEGTIDALMACLRNRISEKPWLEDPSGGSSEDGYIDKLDRLNVLNAQYKSAKVTCN